MFGIFTHFQTMAMTTIPKIKMSKNRKTHLIRKHKTSSKSHIVWCQGSFSQLQCLNKVFRCWGKWLLGWCLEVGRLEMIQHVSRDVCNCKLWTFLSNWIQRFLLLVSTRYIGFCEIKAQWPTSRPTSVPPVPIKGFYSWCQPHILVSVKSKQSGQQADHHQPLQFRLKVSIVGVSSIYCFLWNQSSAVVRRGWQKPALN